ncbi:GNAT family N-acetyltransferase [Pseudoalteromonas sp. '520P1 No. 423']|uniref:GNAT family N-acetyltransferase n=1 Tax=Pseudoalteromonas sp. '520P1 No. 423' TaxID=1690037 RepID=UPI0022B15276|nr:MULTISPECIES: GNAT family N-acetyltransferase [unclassified Pseudoalteromonas]
MEFNKKAIADLEPNQAEVNFSVFARNDMNEVIGGVRCTCYWNTLHIEVLWLSKSCRGQGIVNKLVKQAELFAIENGCEKAFVETTSWQAKPFYEKAGYEHVATLPDRPKGHASQYLTKML